MFTLRDEQQRTNYNEHKAISRIITLWKKTTTSSTWFCPHPQMNHISDSGIILNETMLLTQRDMNPLDSLLFHFPIKLQKVLKSGKPKDIAE